MVNKEHKIESGDSEAGKLRVISRSGNCLCECCEIQY
jgi:hypothetical protein